MTQSKEKKPYAGAWSLGAEVRRRRMELGLTIEELASRAKLSGNFVGTIENGQRDPSISTLLALARGLGVPARDLLPGSEEQSPIAMEMAGAFDRAPPEIKEAVSAVLRFHAERQASRGR